MSLRCVSTFILTKTWNKWLDGAAAFVISCLSFLRSDFKNSGILCISTYFTNHNLVFCHSANHLNVKLSVTLQNQYYVRQNGCPRFKEPQAVKWWCRVNSNEQLYSCTLYKKAIEIKKKIYIKINISHCISVTVFQWKDSCRLDRHHILSMMHWTTVRHIINMCRVELSPTSG